MFLRNLRIYKLKDRNAITVFCFIYIPKNSCIDCGIVIPLIPSYSSNLLSCSIETY